MTDLFPPDKPRLEDVGDADDFHPSSIWDITRKYLVAGLVGITVIFLASYVFTSLPGKHGRYLSLTLIQRISLSVGLATLGVGRMWWRDENSS